LITIEGRAIGPGEPTYVIAEMSGNHDHDLARAESIVRAAADAGADAVKLQTYTADTLTIDAKNEHFRIGGGTAWDGRSLHDLYRDASTPWEWQPRLKALANELGMACFSSPFDESAVAFLESIGVPAYKVASFELVDLELIARIAETGQPMIISTGMGTLEDIDDAISAAREAGAKEIALLKCSSAYPAPPGEVNLRTIPDLQERFGVPVGFSDHTLGVAVPVAAVALGASIIEKHLTLSRASGGSDSSFSAEPAEFAEMVRQIRVAEQAVGAVHYGASPSEEPSRVFRRSLFVVEDTKAGEAFTPTNVRSIRPGSGLMPKHLATVLGRRAARDIARGTPLSWDLVDPNRGV
jgi:N-acetylneuraminate synthase